MKRGYGVVGLPAAGKSAAADMLADETDGILIESGDIVRTGACDHFSKPAESLTSDELGEYSTMRRRRDGGDYVAQDIVNSLRIDPDFPQRPAIVSSIRDSESTAVFDEFFDEYTLIWIHSDFETRFERLRSRGRNDEDEFTREYLNRRDGREVMWGTADLAFDADHRIENAGDLVDLGDGVRWVAQQ